MRRRLVDSMWRIVEGRTSDDRLLRASLLVTLAMLAAWAVLHIVT